MSEPVRDYVPRSEIAVIQALIEAKLDALLVLQRQQDAHIARLLAKIDRLSEDNAKLKGGLWLLAAGMPVVSGILIALVEWLKPF